MQGFGKVKGTSKNRGLALKNGSIQLGRQPWGVFRFVSSFRIIVSGRVAFDVLASSRRSLRRTESIFGMGTLNGD